MFKRNSISEFSIKIKLDSATASRNLKKMQSNLKSFSEKMNATFAKQIAGAKAIREQQKAISASAKAQDKLNTSMGRGHASGIGLVKSFKSLRNLLLAGAGFYAFKNILQGVWNQLSNIVKLGSKVQQSMLTMNAAIGASDIGVSLSPANLKKLQKQQKLFVEGLASTYGLNIANSMSNYAKFFAASSNYIGAKGSQGLFSSLTKLGIVYGLSSEKMDRAMTAFTQMASKNQVMAEELKQQLGDVLPGSMEIFARAMTKMGKYGIVTVEKLYDMMAKGKIIASEVLPYVTEEMNRMSSGSLAAAMGLLSVKIGRLKTAFEIFSTGALNQFSDTLGEIFETLTSILHGKGFQVKVGTWIDNILKSALSLLQELKKGFDEFEKQFSKAKYKEDAVSVLDNFWNIVLFDPLKKVWMKIKEWLSSKIKPVLEPIIINLAQVFADALLNGLKSAIIPDWIEDRLSRSDYDPSRNIKDYSGLELESQVPYMRPQTVIEVGGITNTVHTNDLQKGEEAAKGLGDHIVPTILGLSTGGG